MTWNIAQFHRLCSSQVFVPLASAAKLFHHVLNQCFAKNCSISSYKLEHIGLSSQWCILNRKHFFPFFLAKRYNTAHLCSTVLPSLSEGAFDAVSGFISPFVVQADRIKPFLCCSFLMAVISCSLHLDAIVLFLTSSEAWLLLDLMLLYDSNFCCRLQKSAFTVSSLQLQVSTVTSSSGKPVCYLARSCSFSPSSCNMLADADLFNMLSGESLSACGIRAHWETFGF